MSAPNDRNRSHNHSGKNKLYESPLIPMIKTKNLRDEVPGVKVSQRFLCTRIGAIVSLHIVDIRIGI
jgi:hypothetical protein